MNVKITLRKVIKPFKNAIGRFILQYNFMLIVVLNLLFQLVIIGKYLDNSIVSSYMPTAVDANDYSNRSNIWKSQGFNQAFADAFRMPGYPAIILLAKLIVPSAPYLTVKVFQMVALALSVGLVKVILQKYVPLPAAILFSALYGILPLWHFVPVILAESLTSVLVVLLAFLLSKIDFHRVRITLIIQISACLALATYLKPNNLLLLGVVLAFFAFSAAPQLLKISVKTTAITLLFIAPWAIFANQTQPGFIGLTTNSGLSMYVGSGMVLNYDGSVLSNSAIKWKVDPKSNKADLILMAKTLKESNSNYTEKTLQIWKKRLSREIGYGLDKILIAFGIKSNSLVDHLFGVFTISSLLSGVFLIRLRELRAWSGAIFVNAGLLAMQAFIFQADRRFVVPILFPFSVICLGLFLGNFSKTEFGAKLPLRVNSYLIRLQKRIG